MFANAKNSSDDIIIRLIMDINTTIQKKSLAEEVSSLIREQINDGKLTKGEKLPTEPELMKLFGVGRSTVREAIKMLVNMGYLSVQQGRGTFVESVTETNEPFHQRLKRADIQELREVRDIIEAPIYNPHFQISIESQTKRLNFEPFGKTKCSKIDKHTAQKNVEKTRFFETVC